MNNAFAKTGSADDNSTTIFILSKVSSDSAYSLLMNPTLRAAGSDSVSDVESPSRTTEILGTASATAGLKLGAMVCSDTTGSTVG